VRGKNRTDAGDGNGARPLAVPHTLDAVVAAPGSHRVVLDNQVTRVLEVTIAPASGNQRMLTAGRASWWCTGRRGFATTPATPDVHLARAAVARCAGPAGQLARPRRAHSVENIDRSPYEAVRIEFKQR